MTAETTLEQSVEFAENPEPRCPCVLLLDTSASMQGTPLDALNAGVKTFRDQLVKDPLASRRVEVAMVTFDSEVRVVQNFITANKFDPPVLTSRGFTFMGTGINRALDMINERKALYRANGVSYYRPWVLMITDGEPQGEPEAVVQEATMRLREAEAGKRVAFWAVGVQNAAMQRLSEIVVRTPVKLNGLNFTEMFLWLSTSMQKVAHAQMDEQVALPPPGQPAST